MSITFSVAKTQLTECSALAFTYLSDTYGTTIRIGIEPASPLVLAGSLTSFKRLLPFARSEMNNAMSEVEYMAYSELATKLQVGIDVYEATNRTTQVTGLMQVQ